MNDSAAVFPKYETIDRVFSVVYLMIGYVFICVFTAFRDTWNFSAFTVF